MKVFLRPQAGLSRAMDRVTKALTDFAPPYIEVVNLQTHADVVILHTVGYPETVEEIGKILERGQRYGIIQYCMRTTQEQSTKGWRGIWRGAEVIWSYYDLLALAKEDRVDLGNPPFYYAPLGVDASVFTLMNWDRPFVIFTTGYVAETEGVREASDAAARVRQMQFHLGPELNLGQHVRTKLGIDDTELAFMYNQSQFVAGLRRIEGFEFPVIEGLMCGARPICFDRPHYQAWFHDFAEFIPEGNFDSVVESLTALFKEGARPVSIEERADAAERFDWKRICQGFWSRL